MASSRKRPLGECGVEDLRPVKKSKCIHDNGTRDRDVLQTAKDTIAARPKHPLPSTRLSKQELRPTNISSTATPTRAKPARVSSLKRKDQRSTGRKSISRPGKQLSIHDYPGKENIPPPDFIAPLNTHINIQRMGRTSLGDQDVARFLNVEAT